MRSSPHMAQIQGVNVHRQIFKTDDLKLALERRLGFVISAFERIGGGGAVNFRAKRALDGFLFSVKCYPESRYVEYGRLAANLDAIAGPKTPERIFVHECYDTLARQRIICLKWKSGAPTALRSLTDGQWSRFLDAYLDLSERMQGAKPDMGVRPLKEWRVAALNMCRGLSGRILRPALEAMQDEDLVFVPDLIRTVHGDFHQGNILFSNGEVDCFMDFESLRTGYPAEDIVCYCIDAAKERGRSGRVAMRRILSLFRAAVRRLHYSPHEWPTAINALFLMRLRWKTDDFSHLGLFTAFEMAARARLDDIFRQQV